ncbi:cation transporter [Pelistega sp. NLN82]|uniref:Cation transporter n=1 Tax=Pelistega ratti TaxID=2652177 RepID=A0A6L9Y681_9BURK|nr:cation diffusion facilitator family transporter [Pelistega ratti]NEN75427.1 cation transporter [Pelistega ratti]
MACSHHLQHAKTGKYRTALWLALVINGLMFLVEIIGSIQAGSVSLLADSLDFLGDTANYGVSLFVLNHALRTRAKASLIKGGTMLLFGVFVFVSTVYRWWLGELPNYHEMSLIGTLALLANLWVVWILYRFREGDSNMQSVWLCSRNDALGNFAVILAAFVVYLTQSNLADLFVALFIAYLAISASRKIIHQAKQELNGNISTPSCC